MTHPDLILFFIQLAVMLACALLFGQLLRRLHQPAVLGELLGGILIGPTVFGMLAPDWYGRLFPVSESLALGQDAVIKLGMLFFMFAAGLEVDLAHLRQKGGVALLTAGLGIAVPFGLGFGAVLLLPAVWGGPARSSPLLFGLFIGAALSITALPVIARILVDLNLLNQDFGVVVMVAATLNDLIGWSLFALILSKMAPGSGPGQNTSITLGLVFGFFAITLLLGRWLSLKALPWLQTRIAWPSGFIGLAAVLVLLAAAAAETIGVHSFFGAFLVGVGLGQSVERPQRAFEAVHQFAISFLAPIYFVSIGLQANFATHFDWLLVLVVTVVACAGKIIGAGLGAWLGGMPGRTALAVGFAMNARGAMELILASIALNYGLIDQRLFIALIIMALVTSVLSGPAIRQLLLIRPVAVETRQVVI
jgi:Kef-type K+ transport system membrane component KefB